MEPIEQVSELLESRTFVKASNVAQQFNLSWTRASELLKSYCLNGKQKLTVFVLARSSLNSDAIMTFKSCNSLRVKQCSSDAINDECIVYALSSHVGSDSQVFGLHQSPPDLWTGGGIAPIISPTAVSSGAEVMINGAVNKPSSSNKRKKAVSRKRVYKDQSGRMVTETVVEYETASESEEVSANSNQGHMANKKLKQPPSDQSGKNQQSNAKKPASSAASSSKNLKQKSLMSFFAKK